jgi:diguanylate cyclase (GGDEF)-like protein/PAS domain S-box-containing protein
VSDPTDSPPRLQALERSGLLDGGHPAFDRFARLAARTLNAPIGLVSAVADDHCVLVAAFGAGERGLTTPVEGALCRTVVETGAPLVVGDTRAAGVAGNLGLGAYCGVPMRAPTGEVLGALCAAAPTPRTWAPDDVAALADLSMTLTAELERRHVHAVHDKTRQTEARFRGLVETAPAVSYVAEYDDRGGLRYVSPQIEALTGYPKARFTEDPEFWRSIVHPDDRERVFAQVEEDWRAERPFTCEYRYLTADGRTVWVWEREVIVRDDEGRPLYTQGVVLDITSRREAEDALETTQAHMATVVEAAPMILFAFDADGTITLSEGKQLEALGSRPNQSVGRSIFEFVGEHPDHRRHVERALAGETFSAVTEFGGLVLDAYFTPRLGPTGAVEGVIAVCTDITDRRRDELRIAQLAYEDTVTGLPNRARLRERLEAEIERARALAGHVALLYIDLDRFKLVNDALGHAAGDALLRDVGERISAALDGAGMLARHGGDEFVVLLGPAHAGSRENAEHLAGRIMAALRPPFALRGAEFELGASVGVARYPEHGVDPDALLEHADAAMYQAKCDGRRRVRVFHADAEDSRQRLTLTARLRRALVADEFVLHYQPVFDLITGAPVSLEALIRWEHPEHGLVPPARFIPHAEETGFIDELGAWVIEAACEQAASWRTLGLAPQVSFNVAPGQLRRPDLADTVTAAIAARGLEPEQFGIEVTESAAVEDLDRARGTLQRLRDHGLRVAIDDFGASHSSLGRLRKLPVDLLKIDRSFLNDVPQDPEAAAIVTAVLALAAGLGLDAVAEGIETDGQRRFLVSEGWPLGQGFHLGRPLPAADTTRLLLEHAGATRVHAA